MARIFFFNEEINFKLKEKKKIKQWIAKVILKEQKELSLINYIFCDDAYLHQINMEYLAHDTFTDIITFDNSEEEGLIEADIYISIERVKENASKFNTDFHEELRRVLIHGVLHLCGYPDKSKEESRLMRKKEEEALLLFSSDQKE